MFPGNPAAGFPRGPSRGFRGGLARRGNGEARRPRLFLGRLVCPGQLWPGSLRPRGPSVQGCRHVAGGSLGVVCGGPGPPLTRGPAGRKRTQPRWGVCGWAGGMQAQRARWGCVAPRLLCREGPAFRSSSLLLNGRTGWGCLGEGLVGLVFQRPRCVHVRPSLPTCPPPAPLGNHVCSVNVCLCFCFANNLICALFLDARYKQ